MALSLFSTALAAAIAAAAVTAGVAARAEAVEKRANGHLFMCTDTGFYGQCQNVAFNLGTCYNINAPSRNAISSLGPDGFACTIWRDDNYNGPSVSGIVAPGINDLRDFGLND